MTNRDPDELDIKFAEEEDVSVFWSVEVEFSDSAQKSVFYSARRIVLDGEYAQIQLPDGTYASFPIGQIRKVLSMRADPPTGYTDKDLSADELY